MSKNDADKKIIEEALKRFKECEEFESDNRKTALEDLNFSLGDQWPETIRNSRENDPDGSRPCLTVDKLGQYIRQVVNDCRQNRPSIKVKPVDSKGDPEAAEIYQGLVRHIEYESQADVAYDVGIEMAVRAGFGFLRVLAKYADETGFDQEGEVVAVHNPFSCYLDSNRKKIDGSDSKYGFIFDDMPIDQFKEVHSGAASASINSGSPNPLWMKKDTVRVAEYFRVEEERTTIWQGPNGEASFVEISGAKSRKITRRKVMWYKITSEEILERSEFPCKYIPIIPIYGHMINVAGKMVFTGLIHPAIDAQRIYNYSLSSYVERVALMPKAPYIAAEGQLEGHEAEWRDANTSNTPVLTYKPTDLNGQPVPPPQRQAAADVPTGWLQAVQMTEHDIQAALGMYNASVGAPSNERTGVAITARAKEADNATFHFVDNLSRSIRHVARILVDMIPRIYDTARTARILGEDGSSDEVLLVPGQSSPVGKVVDEEGKIKKAFSLDVGKYDVAVSVGPGYSTRRQEAADFMSQIVQTHPEMMNIIGDLMFKSMDMPYAEDIAERLKKMIPPELQDAEENGPPQLPESVRQTMQMAAEHIQQLAAQVEEAQKALDEATNSSELDRAKLLLEERKIELAEYEAYTERQVALGAGGEGKEPVEREDVAESQALQGLMQRVDAIAQLLQQMQQAPQQSPVQVFVDGTQKPSVKRARAVRDESGAWVMESVEEPVSEPMGEMQ